MKKDNLIVLITCLLLTQFFSYSQEIPFVEYINFSSVKPTGITLEYCWNALGVDSSNNIYVVFGGPYNKVESGYMFKYNADTKNKEYLGSFIDILKANDNYEDNESVPKGHTELPFYKGIVYFGTQPFHDLWGGTVYDLENYRGSHLIAYDTLSQEVKDLSKNKAGGVFQDYQGIMGLQAMPDSDYIVCFSHPRGDLLLYNPGPDSVVRIVPGPVQNFGLHVPRCIVVYKTKVFYAMGWMDSDLYVYDLSDNTLIKTNQKTTGGFWNGKAQTSDGRHVYLMTALGNLYHLDAETNHVEFLSNVFVGDEFEDAGAPYNQYCLSMSVDQSCLYFIPTRTQPGSMASAGYLYKYDLTTNIQKMVGWVGNGTYTGNNIHDREGNLYFAWHNNSIDGKLIRINRRALEDISTSTAGSFRFDSEVTQPFSLEQNRPNPFSEATSVILKLEVEAHVTVDIFDYSGKNVSFPVKDYYTSGQHQLMWNGNDYYGKPCKPGLYILRVQIRTADQVYVLNQKLTKID